MAKLLKTRIKNRLDSLSNWQQEGVELLAGEIALVQVPTGETYLNPVTNKNEPVIELLMKVGEEGKTFSQLPWLSAKAADVYSWAKTQNVEDVEVTVITVPEKEGTPASSEKKKLADWLAELYQKNTVQDAKLADHETKLNTLIGAGSGSVSEQITNAISLLDSTLIKEEDADNQPLPNQIVKEVTQTDGVVTVTYGKITRDELPTIEARNIEVTAASAENAALMLDTKLLRIDGRLSDIELEIKGGVHFIGTTHEEPSIVEGKTYVKLDGSSEDKYAEPGEIVIYIGTENLDTDGDSATSDEVNTFEREYISTGSSWQLLGDLSRVGILDDWRKGLDYSDVVNGAAKDSKFVTSVTQTDGKIAVTYARPAAADISYNESSNVSAALNAIEGSYMRIGNEDANGKAPIYFGTSTDTIIFDCGGAL